MGDTEPSSSSDQHYAIVLFYKYFLPRDFPLLHTQGPQASSFYESRLSSFQKDLCQSLNLKGRVLLSREGINGTLSAPSNIVLQKYIDTMTQFELVRECGLPPEHANEDNPERNQSFSEHYLFQGVDWKRSSCEVPGGSSLDSVRCGPQTMMEPFPDLKISIVKEIISTGGSTRVDDLSSMGGTHLSPSEFHRAILENDNVVLIDVRNTFEYNIGHFVDPKTNQDAINPETVTFSSFDSSFCAKKADELKDKKVLMYCTGGIRCEKASVMLKKRGVKDVSQLKGGIHRYLEEYGEDGLFRGLNFVFDQRVAMKPAECKIEAAKDDVSAQPHEIIGTCLECKTPFDELSGSRICTVCRDLVLVCPSCTTSLREYHCSRHQTWKHCYFTFLQVFDQQELNDQYVALVKLRDLYSNKNIRKTLFRQMEKVQTRIQQLQEGRESMDRNAPRYCRSCMETSNVCNGLCWGFWKSKQDRAQVSRVEVEPLRPIVVGQWVEPGPHWNALRYGSKVDTSIGEAPSRLKRGRVTECKPWGAGGTERDCVVVEWINYNGDDDDDNDTRTEPFRWGVIGRDGRRLYDLQIVEQR